MIESQELYHKIERILLEQDLIDQELSNIATRFGTRKYGRWKRHIIDLCNFVIKNRKLDVEIETFLKNCIEWCKRT